MNTCVMVMGLRRIYIFLLLQCGDGLFYTSESDVYRRQILTNKVHPRTVRGEPFNLLFKQCFSMYSLFAWYVSSVICYKIFINILLTFESLLRAATSYDKYSIYSLLRLVGYCYRHVPN